MSILFIKTGRTKKFVDEVCNFGLRQPLQSKAVGMPVSNNL